MCDCTSNGIQFSFSRSIVASPYAFDAICATHVFDHPYLFVALASSRARMGKVQCHVVCGPSNNEEANMRTAVKKA